MEYQLPSVTLDGVAAYQTDLSLLAKSVWRNLPFPDAKLATQLRSGSEYAAPPVQALGVPMWFKLTLGGVELTNEQLITVTGAKTIVKTQVAGGDFTVKEIIGLDDYKVNIKGVCVREGNRFGGTNSLVAPDYPEEQLRDLVALYRRNEALDVRCQLLSYFNITRLVMEDISFPAMPGSQGFVAYEINAVSDESMLAKLIRTT
jgi:hypothetical protein